MSQNKHTTYELYNHPAVKLTATIYTTSDQERVTVIDGHAFCTCRVFAINNMLYYPECKHTQAVEATVEADKPAPVYRFLNTDTGDMEDISDW
jgi:predicted nucleic acid-binding Zn finger protein